MYYFNSIQLMTCLKLSNIKCWITARIPDNKMGLTVRYYSVTGTFPTAKSTLCNNPDVKPEQALQLELCLGPMKGMVRLASNSPMPIKVT